MQLKKWQVKKIKQKLREIYNMNSLEPELIWGEQWFYNTVHRAEKRENFVYFKAICPKGQCLGGVMKKIEKKGGE